MAAEEKEEDMVQDRLRRLERKLDELLAAATPQKTKGSSEEEEEEEGSTAASVSKQSTSLEERIGSVEEEMGRFSERVEAMSGVLAQVHDKVSRIGAGTGAKQDEAPAPPATAPSPIAAVEAEEGEEEGEEGGGAETRIGAVEAELQQLREEIDRRFDETTPATPLRQVQSQPQPQSPMYTKLEGAVDELLRAAEDVRAIRGVRDTAERELRGAVSLATARVDAIEARIDAQGHSVAEAVAGLRKDLAGRNELAERVASMERAIRDLTETTATQRQRSVYRAPLPSTEIEGIRAKVAYIERMQGETMERVKSLEENISASMRRQEVAMHAIDEAIQMVRSRREVPGTASAATTTDEIGRMMEMLRDQERAVQEGMALLRAQMAEADR
jgi:ribosomal protein S13